MAKGRPDWTTSINITGQDLLEVISRPKYGTALTATTTVILNEGVETDIISVAGTGMIYGGIIKHTGTFDPEYIVLNAVIDGTTLLGFSLGALNRHFLENESMWHFYEKYYSEENDKYIQGITHGITFEESWVFHINNATGSGSVDGVTIDVMYALI